MKRRTFLGWLAGLPFVGALVGNEKEKNQKVLKKDVQVDIDFDPLVTVEPPDKVLKVMVVNKNLVLFCKSGLWQLIRKKDGWYRLEINQ